MNEDWEYQKHRENIERVAAEYVEGYEKIDCESKMVRVWQFKDAPKVLQYLSTNGGDEDTLWVIPPTLGNDMDWEIEKGAICDVDFFTLSNGWRVAITLHS